MKNKKTLNNVLFSIIQQIITIVCGFIAPRFIIMKYGSNVNGIVSSITQFLGYITLLEAGIAPVVKALLYKAIVKQDKDKIERILKATEKFFRSIALIFILYLLFLCFGFAIFYADEYSYVYTFSLVAIIAISTFFEYFFGMTYSVYLQAEQRTYIVAVIKTISKIINTLLIVILVLSNCSIHVVKLASSFVFILAPLVQNYYVKKKFKINLKNVDKNYKLENKWYGFSQHIAAIIHDSVDVGVLTFLANPLEVSVYSIYMLVINSIKNLTLSLSGGIDALFGNILAKEDKQELEKKFVLYEVFYYTIITILFVCTFILVVPFVKVYTKGVTDVNYIRPTFACIMVIAEFVMAIRVPFNNLALAAGHFKQIKKGAWVEAILNIVVSVILVSYYGIVGVAIGTLVAMFIRTVEFVIYSSKNILNRKIFSSIKRICLAILEFIILIILFKLLPQFTGDSYISWFVYAFKVGAITVAVVSIINVILYRSEVKELKNYIIKRGEK